MKEKKFDIILFDLDGTLTDPKEGITKSVQYALHYFDIEEPNLDVLEPFIGPPLKESFMEFYKFTDEKALQAIEKYRERFKAAGIFENVLYPGITELLAECKEQGMRLAIASSKPEVYVKKILKYFKLDSYFDVVTGSELDGSRDKKEEVIKEALRRLFQNGEVKRDHILMVGDRKFDITGGKANGIHTAAVRYGYAQKGELEAEKPDYLIASVEELSKLVLGRARKNEQSFQKVFHILIPFFFYFIGNWTTLAVLQILYTLFLPPFKDQAQTSVWWAVLNAVSMIGGAGAAIAAAFWEERSKGIGYFKYIKNEFITKNKPIRPVSGLCLIVLSVSLAVGLNVLAGLTDFFSLSERYIKSTDTMYAVPYAAGLILYGLVAPLAEEIVFRGILYNRVKQYFPLGLSIVVSAVMFAFYHGNLVQGVYALFMGIMLAYIYEIYKSFMAPFLFHLAANAAVFSLAYEEHINNLLYTPVNCFISLSVAIMSLLFVLRIENSKIHLFK